MYEMKRLILLCWKEGSLTSIQREKQLVQIILSAKKPMCLELEDFTLTTYQCHQNSPHGASPTIQIPIEHSLKTHRSNALFPRTNLQEQHTQNHMSLKFSQLDPGISPVEPD